MSPSGHESLYERASRFSGQALDRLTLHEIPPTPSNFTLLYSYSQGDNLELMSAIDELIGGASSIDYARVDEVYRKFFAFQEYEETVGSAATGLTRTLGDTIEAIKETGAGNKGSGSELVGAIEALSADETLSANNALRTVLAETQAIVTRSKRLSDRFERSLVEIASLRDNLDAARREAQTDQLTGIGNRRFLETELHRVISQARDESTDLSVIMADVDHFKRFNDKHGHKIGDEVLKIVGRQLATKVEAPGMAARYGGEEFIAMLPGAGLDSAMALAERIRGTFDDRELRAGSGATYGKITISFGTACYRSGESASQLVDRADAALYVAKKLGRNRVASEREIE